MTELPKFHTLQDVLNMCGITSPDDITALKDQVRKLGCASIIGDTWIFTQRDIDYLLDASVPDPIQDPTLMKHIADKSRMVVYLISGGPYYKIGQSQNVWERLKSLQTSNPTTLRLEAVLPSHVVREKYLHEIFSGLRTSGEWFHRHKDISCEFRALCRAFAAV